MQKTFSTQSFEKILLSQVWGSRCCTRLGRPLSITGRWEVAGYFPPSSSSSTRITVYTPQSSPPLSHDVSDVRVRKVKVHLRVLSVSLT